MKASSLVCLAHSLLVVSYSNAHSTMQNLGGGGTLAAVPALQRQVLRSLACHAEQAYLAGKGC
jgi:hypothetical protein